MKGIGLHRLQMSLTKKNNKTNKKKQFGLYLYIYDLQI